MESDTADTGTRGQIQRTRGHVVRYSRYGVTVSDTADTEPRVRYSRHGVTVSDTADTDHGSDTADTGSDIGDMGTRSQMQWTRGHTQRTQGHAAI